MRFTTSGTVLDDLMEKNNCIFKNDYDLFSMMKKRLKCVSGIGREKSLSLEWA